MSQIAEIEPTMLPYLNEEFIKSRIFTVRGVQVMLDSDLARIYQVETRVFNQSVKRNENRFPLNFRFLLELEEYRTLISQIVTSKNTSGETRGGRQKRALLRKEAHAQGVEEDRPCRWVLRRGHA